jgi:hypothetical protein
LNNLSRSGKAIDLLFGFCCFSAASGALADAFKRLISPPLSFHSRSRPFKAVGKNQTETTTRKLDQFLSTKHPHADS